MTEVVIAGGGPVGMRVAQRTAEKGLETLVLEKGRKIGYPVQCAGLVSPRVVSMTGTDHVLRRGRKAYIHPPDGEPLKIEAPEPKAMIIDRGRFDREMAAEAVRKGAQIELGARVLDTSVDGKRTIKYRRDGEDRTIEAEILIGADGPTSTVRRSAGLPGPDELLPGLQAVVGKEKERIELFLGERYASDFFAWDLPHPSGTLVGLASGDGNVYRHFLDLLREREHEDDMLAISAGTIPLGNIGKSVKERLALVGDAACQVKPLSGGGLFLGLKAADILSEVVVDSMAKGDLSEERLQEYHEGWQIEVGKEISKGMWMRRVYRDLSDGELSDMIDSLRKEKVKNVIGKKGDIDYPSAVAKSVLKASPKLLKFAGPLIKNIF